MQTINVRQKLIDRLVTLNEKHQFLLSADASAVDWTNVKRDIQKDLNRLKKNAKAYEILAYLTMGLTALITLFRLFNENGGPDLNKGALFILLTVAIVFSAFSQRLRVAQVEKQIILLDILEIVDTRKQMGQ